MHQAAPTAAAPLTRWLRRAGQALLAAALLLPAGLAFGAVQPEGPGYNFPRDVSLEGWRIDQLIYVTTIFVVLLFVIMCIWMVWACIFHNEEHEALYDHGDTKKSIGTALLISSVIFFVVDGNLFVNSVIDMRDAFWNFERAESDPDHVKLEINARQWAWEARYPGNDGEFNTPDDIVVLNDIKVPVDAPVIVQMGAVDVIHSLYLPNLRVKTDAVPGMINQLWFQATETGDFEIACAQHCGTHHYKMKGVISILPRADYDAWVKEQSAKAKLNHDPDDEGAQWGWAWDRS